MVVEFYDLLDCLGKAPDMRWFYNLLTGGHTSDDGIQTEPSIHEAESEPNIHEPELNDFFHKLHVITSYNELICIEEDLLRQMEAITEIIKNHHSEGIKDHFIYKDLFAQFEVVDQNLKHRLEQIQVYEQLVEQVDGREEVSVRDPLASEKMTMCQKFIVEAKLVSGFAS